MSKTTASAAWLTQFGLLMWKNWTLSKRGYKIMVMQILSPFFFILALYVMNEVLSSASKEHLYDDQPTPEPERVGQIPRCIVGSNKDRCWTIAYAPRSTNSTSIVETLMAGIRADSDLPEDQVIGFDTEGELHDFVYNNPNTTQGGYVFNVSQVGGDTVVGFTLLTNQTNQMRYGKVIKYATYVQVPMMVALQRQLFKYATNNPNFVFSVDAIEFARPPPQTLNIIGRAGSTFFFGCLMFNFVMALVQISTERELRLRATLNLMGLRDSVYWSTWMITYVFFATWTVLLLCAFGAAFQFDFFLDNNFGTYFILLELFALSLVPLSFLTSTLLKKSSSAISMGFFVFVIGFFFQLTAVFLYDDDASGGTVIGQYILAWFSPVMLAKGLNDIGEAQPGYSFGDVVDNTDKWPLIQLYIWMILDFFLYLGLALWFDNILPNEHGVRRPWYYFVTPSYWTGKVSARGPQPHGDTPPDETVDEDVYAEEKNVRTDNLPESTAVKIMNLNKTYPGSRKKLGKNKCTRCCLNSFCCCCGKRTPFQAVSDVWYHIDSNHLFCLLGHNGAGKTTTINMLTGQISPTHGDAEIYGYSILTHMDKIREMMGVCPQFDVLWADLTGREHLMLFAGMKGIPWKKLSQEADDRLGEVSLTKAMNRLSSGYSGGMKRRLSVAVALVGDPKVVFLDEPTTGMDPVSRREVWDIIERAKKGRVVILTTHSMEEADTLADTIAIMAKGQLQCMGSAIHLKKKFGAGYQITVAVRRETRGAVTEFFESQIEGVVMEADGVSDYLNFAIPADFQDLSSFLALLETKKKELGISDVLVSLTTLEEVFLRITEEAENRGEQDDDGSDDDIDDDDDMPISPKAVEMDVRKDSAKHKQVEQSDDDNSD